jgi:hypothetical protein
VKYRHPHPGDDPPAPGAPGGSETDKKREGEKKKRRDLHFTRAEIDERDKKSVEK